MDNKQRLYKLRSVKIGWINEQMYHLLLKKESKLNMFIHSIKIIVFIINIIASAVGEDVNYRWWTITTSMIIAFDVYINKMKDETAYGSKIELHRAMTDDCIRFNEILESSEFKSDSVEIAYQSLIEKSSKLHIDPVIFDNWDQEFKKRGIKELNAFDTYDQLIKEMHIIPIESNPVEAKVPAETKLTKQLTNIQLNYSPRLNNPSATSITSQTKNSKAAFELTRMFDNFNAASD